MAADAQRQELESLIGMVRQIKMQVDQLGVTYPASAQSVAAINQQLQQIIISAAQQASAQTASGMSVPTSGGGV